MLCLVWRDLSQVYREKMDDELEREGGTAITWDLLVKYMRKRAHRCAHYSKEKQINDIPSGPAIEPANEFNTVAQTSHPKHP